MCVLGSPSASSSLRCRRASAQAATHLEQRRSRSEIVSVSDVHAGGHTVDPAGSMVHRRRPRLWPAPVELDDAWRYLLLALSDTQRPNVPYLALNAVALARSSPAHALAADTLASCCACAFSPAFADTHLPNAFER